MMISSTKIVDNKGRYEDKPYVQFMRGLVSPAHLLTLVNI